MSSPLRIAVWHDPPLGGAQRALSELLRGLAQRGHRVDVFRPGGPRRQPTSEDSYGLQVRAVPFQGRAHRRLAFYWNDYRTLRDLQDFDRAEAALAGELAAYSAVLCSVLHDGTAPSLLCYSPVPTIYYCHEPPRRFYEPWCRPEAAPLTPFERARLLWRRPAQALLDRYLQARDRRNVRQADLVLTNSRYTASRVQQVYGRDAEVCYLGVDSERFRPAEGPSSERRVLSVGALEAHKGFDFLIESVSLLPPEQRPRLTIAGSGGHPNMPAHLRRLAGARGVRLDLLQSISDQELRSLYQNSEVFVFGARMEPFGLVLLEAMACGLPVVAVAEGGVPEIVQDGLTGYLTPRSPEQFAHRLQELLESPARRVEMATQGRSAAARDWRWDTAVDRLEEALLRVAAPRAVAAGAAV